MEFVLAGVCAALLALHLWERYQAIIRESFIRAERLGWNEERRGLIRANEAEREAWSLERKDLNNRIQVPEAAPFMDPDTGDDDEPQYVPFEDDAAFLKATEG